MKNKWMAKRKEITQNNTLANQIGRRIAWIMAGVFVFLIIATVSLASYNVNSAVSSELSLNASNAANQIESVFNTASYTAEDIERYLVKAFSLEEKGASNMAGEIIAAKDTRTYTSMIYGDEISELHADVEKYLIEAARNTVLGENCVDGVGVMFEPNAFDKNIESYAFYIDATLGESEIPKSFGEYDAYSQEEYYAIAKKTGAEVCTDPYTYNGKLMISYAVPIIYNGEVKGVVMADVNVDNFADFISTNAKYPSMYTTIYNNNYIDIYDSETREDIGKLMDVFYSNEKQLANVKSKMEAGSAFVATTTRENGTRIVRYFAPISVGDTTYWSMTALSQTDKNADSVMMIIMMIVISAIALVIIVATLVKILLKKLQPIAGIVTAAEQISLGNLDIELEASSDDEIGTLAKAFQNTISGLKLIIEDIDYILSAMADGNFAIRTREEEAYVGNYQSILLSMRKLNRNLSSTLFQIVEASDQVALGSNQMAESAQSLAEGATEQAGAVEELTATVEDVATAATNSAKKTEEAYQKSQEYKNEAENSAVEMEKLNEAMNRISETSQQIAQIIGEIEDIASQTNLLSLNASIEAARAGEAGRGFAVVADQIGKLASDSAQSAVNTRELISKALEEINNGNEITGKTAESLTKVIEGINMLAEASQETSQMSITQAESLEQVQQGIEQISNVVQGNSAAAEETSATSEELSAQAESLKSLVDQFELREE